MGPIDDIEHITAHNNLAVFINAQVDQEPWPSEAANMQAIQATPPPQSGSHRLNLVCISCDENCGSKAFTAACEHTYCINCLVDYVSSALDPGETFPPLCCNRPFTIQLVEDHLSRELVLRYRAKQASIKEACSLICAESGCRLIIEREDVVGDLGHCRGCNRYTCTRCRTTQHKGKECPTDAERQGILKLAKDKGWQACYQCNNMIELNFGCNHMTCVCRAEFCYVCGTRWKNCDCLLFANDYIDDWIGPDDFIEDHAGAGAARPAGPRFQRRTVFRADKALARYEKHLGQTLAWKDRRPREEQVAEIRAVIETGCDHGYWRRVRTDKNHPGHCNLCNYVGRKFIFQCFNCPLTACWACHTDEPPEYMRVEPEAEADV